jgi:hypothetical protein
VKIRNFVVVAHLTLVCVPFCTPHARAQQAQPPTTVRYHFGDDRDGKLGWANPSFDDSAWPVAKDGRWPIPPLYSDGFVWVRLHIAVSSRASLPLAVRSSPPFLIAVDTERHALEIYAGGALVGRQGSLPPEVDLDLDHRDAIFDLPASAASPGATTLVALRTWYPPVRRGPTSFTTWIISVDESRVLQLARRADHATITYANLLDLELNGLMVLLGVGVFFAWRWLGGRDLLVFSWVLIAHALFELSENPSLPGLGAISWRTQWIIQLGIAFPALLADIEFTWTVHGLRAIKLKRLAQALAVALAIVALYFVLPTTPTALTFWAGPVYLLAFLGFSLTLVGVNLWAILVRRRNQLIAVAIIAYATAAVLPQSILPTGVMVGPFYESTLGLAFFLFAIALFLLLSQRAWRAWRARDELRVEFEAAREVQERLVSPAVDLPRFKIQSAYLPAKHVGGDFFRVLPEPDGGVLVVVGDVSGKGLRAAMTVSAIIGALRTMPVLPPARILAALNRGLVGQLQGGFVTCCVARIGEDGAITIANAGQIAPYLNGAELEVPAGLPLGVEPIEYEELHLQVSAGHSLTFVSDGVVEARNAAGELFGFERTRAISGQSANQIANAAKLFGQEDDITVLTLQRSVPA